ncbi:MAG: glycosyltransferase family 39 protein [candidate division KSB1 bacterium]|nr:glycosyltransferase family 39 protein [candidate division KSB1 bacterium]
MNSSKFENKKRNWMGLYGLVLLAFVLVRLFVWKRTTLLEDHDSVGYLESIKTFLRFDLDQIIRLSPDTTPLYPLLASLFSWLSGSVETGARLCSLVASLAVMVALVGIGQRFLSPLAITLGLCIVAFSPALIPFSISVLTEPLFIAVVYLGLWLFWRQYERPTKARAAMLGLTFGLSFLARTEGLVFLATVPVLQFVYSRFFQPSKYDSKNFLGWTFCFVIGFATVGFLQIWRVSHLMGRFAINGRQAWELILNRADGKSYEEKIYGLDYSPKQLNLDYIQSNPEILRQFESSISVSRLAKTVARNVNDLSQQRLGELLGPVVLIFFVIGVLGVVSQRKFYEALLIFAFVGITLIAPLIHDHNLPIRNIAVIAPLMMLVAGGGMLYLPRLLLSLIGKDGETEGARKAFAFGCLSLLMLSNTYALRQTFRPPTSNFEYSPESFKQPLTIINQQRQLNPGQTPKIVLRKAYFSYMAGAQVFFIPFTDYQRFVRYCWLNEIDYLFLQDHLVAKFPFFERFQTDPEEFECLYRGVDELGNLMRLYRFKMETVLLEDQWSENGPSRAHP